MSWARPDLEKSQNLLTTNGQEQGNVCSWAMCVWKGSESEKSNCLCTSEMEQELRRVITSQTSIVSLASAEDFGRAKEMCKEILALILAPFQPASIYRLGSSEKDITAVYPKMVLCHELAQWCNRAHRDGISRDLGIKLPAFFWLL